MKQKVLILIIVVIVFLIIAWYMRKSREGFQTPSEQVKSVLSSPDQVTPDMCVIVKNMHEQIKAKYVESQKENNIYIKETLTASMSAIEDTIKKMGC